VLLLLFSYIINFDPGLVKIIDGHVYYGHLPNYGRIGAPPLPIVRKIYPIPYGMEIAKVDILIPDSIVLAENFDPVRVEPPKGPIELPMPDPPPDLYPERIVTFRSGFFRGLGILNLLIFPIRYRRHSLILYPKIIIHPRYRPASSHLPERMGAYSQHLTREIYHRLTGEYPSLPPLPGKDLLVVAPHILAPVAERYVEMKRKHGFLTELVYVEDLIRCYPQCDNAASIRCGIRDLYKKYGFSFLALIGDHPLIPARKFHWVYENCLLGRDIPTDLYYSCLDGDWNFDRDSYFGEFEDSVDLYPDIFVGRIPVANEREGMAYLDKLERMNFGPDTTIGDKIIFLCSSLFSKGDALMAAESIIAKIPDTLQPFISVLHDTIPNLLNKRIAFDSIRSGYRIIFGFGHGNPTRFQYDGEYGELPDFDTLKNETRTNLFYHITCSNCSFETECVGEHLINQHGGGLNFIGPAWVSFLYPHTYLAQELVQHLASFPIGISVPLSFIKFIPQLETDPIYRLIAFEINTLGDPTISYPLRSHHPITNFTYSDTILTGLDRIDFSYSPPELARISILSGESHKTKIAWGSGWLETYCDSPGTGILTLSRPGEPIVLDTIVILEPDYHLKIVDHRYSPGKPNPFERGSLRILLRNTGLVPSPMAIGTITTENPKVEIINGSVTIPPLSPQENLWTQPFVLHFYDLKDREEVRTAITIITTEPEFFDTLTLTIATPVITRLKNLIRDESGNGRIEPNERFSLQILFGNYGEEESDSLIACLKADTHYVILESDSALLLPISPGEQETLGPFSGRATNYWYPEVSFTLDLDTISYHFELDPPSPPTSAYAFPTDSGNTIFWQSPPEADLAGYFIYRHENGKLISINPRPIKITRYTDTIIGGCCYHITAVDTSVSESALSDSILVSRFPSHPGFPAPLSYYCFASPKIADLDPDYPGLEIIQGCWDGKLFLYHENGTGGYFTSLDGPIWATPAIGDVDHDGELDIVCGTRTNPAKLYVLDRNGNPKPGFPVTLEGSILSSVAIADLDSDQKLELTLVTTSGIFYIIDDDGVIAFSRKLGGYHWGAPAIGDLDDDGELEVVPPSGNDTVYVFEADGSSMEPFPVPIPGKFFYGPTIADLDRDRRLEIVLGLSISNEDKIVILDDDGTILPGWPQTYNQRNVDDYVSFGDLDHDGAPELILDYELYTWTGGITVINPNGNVLKGWPQLRGEGSSNTVVVDIDGDRRPEVVCGSADRKIYAFHPDGSYCPGFPIQIGHTIYTTPAIADVDEDGRLELAIAALDWKLYLFDLEGPAAPDRLIWPCFRSDLYNTGCYHPPQIEVGESGANLKRRIGVIPVPCLAPLAFSYNTDAPISLSVFDVLGRRIESETLIGRGRYRLDLAAGIYFLRFRWREEEITRKVVILR